MNNPSPRDTWQPAKKVIVKTPTGSPRSPGTSILQLRPSAGSTSSLPVSPSITREEMRSPPTPTLTNTQGNALSNSDQGKPVWNCSRARRKSAKRKTIKLTSPVLGERRQSQAPPPNVCLSNENKTHQPPKEAKRKSTRRSVRKSLWAGKSSVNIVANGTIAPEIINLPKISENRRFDEISARILEEAYREEIVFSRCTELLKTWFYVPLLAALGPRSEDRLKTIFCGVNELERNSRKVLTELSSIAQSGRPFLLGETYGGCDEYIKAHEEFIKGHRAGLSTLTTLINSDVGFSRFLNECSRACGGINIFDLFWVILQRFCTICKLSMSHSTLVNTVNSVHATINSCNAFFSAHAPFKCETTCYRVAKAGPGKPAAAVGYTRLLSLQCEAQNLCEAHASMATFRTIEQPKLCAPIPILHNRFFISSASVILKSKPFYGCVTESQAEILAFSDGIALCRPTPKGPMPRALIQWYPANELCAFTSFPEPIEGNDTSPFEDMAETLGTEDSSLPASVATAIILRRDEKKFSFTLTLATSANTFECPNFIRAANKAIYASCERMIHNVTNGKRQIEEFVNPTATGEQCTIFGRDLESLLARDQYSRPGITVPVLPQRLCHYIIVNCLAEQGIFRVAAGKRVIDTVYKRINSGELDQVNFGEESTHLAPSLLKTFFRDLPSPLIPQDLYVAFTAMGALDGIEVNAKAEAVAAASRNKRAVIKDLIRRIPKPNRDLLTYIMSFFSQVAANKHANCMDAGNLAIVTAPNILYVKDSSESFPNISNANNVISYLIANYDELFDAPRRSWISFKRKLVGHANSVSTICTTKCDGGLDFVVSGDRAGKCYVWNASDATYQRTFDLPSKNITASLSIGSTFWIATDNAIHIVDSTSFEILKTIEASVFTFALTGDKSEVWCGSQGKVLVISVTEQAIIAELPTPDNADILTMAQIPDTETIWSAGRSNSSDNLIYVWDTSEKYVMGQFPAHKKRINSIVVVGIHIWTADDEGSICLWDGDTGKLIHTIPHHLGPVYSLCALNDQVWSCSWDKTICIWDPETFDLIAEIVGYFTDSVTGLYSVKNGNSVDIWSFSGDRSICVWNTVPRTDDNTYPSYLKKSK